MKAHELIKKLNKFEPNLEIFLMGRILLDKKERCYHPASNNIQKFYYFNGEIYDIPDKMVGGKEVVVLFPDFRV